MGDQSSDRPRDDRDYGARRNTTTPNAKLGEALMRMSIRVALVTTFVVAFGAGCSAASVDDATTESQPLGEANGVGKACGAVAAGNGRCHVLIRLGPDGNAATAATP